jgi:hypothetical protein
MTISSHSNCNFISGRGRGRQDGEPRPRRLHQGQSEAAGRQEQEQEEGGDGGKKCRRRERRKETKVRSVTHHVCLFPKAVRTLQGVPKVKVYFHIIKFVKYSASSAPYLPGRIYEIWEM